MPFTFSHPAIVLPLKLIPKKWFSLTASVIGSLTPDFEYFIRMKVQSNFSHTILGVFWFDLPLGILLAFLFHNIVRNSLFDNLPLPLKSRLIGFNKFNWNRYFWVFRSDGARCFGQTVPLKRSYNYMKKLRLFLSQNSFS